MKIPFAGNIAVNMLRRQVLKANCDITSFLESKQAKQLLRGYTETDLQFFSDPMWAKLMYQSMAEAFRQDSGVSTVVDEHMLFLKPWGFSLENIPAGKLVVWHGADDKTVSVSNGYALADAVKGSQLEVFNGLGHCAIFNYKDKLAEVLLE
jgi:pimeloyl-ACP methyl ester carboxylesterase